MSSKDVGDLGESLAVDYLQKKGCKIIARNWRCRFAELDIIATDPDNTLLIVEVKSSKTIIDKSADFFPEIHFNATKRNRVRAAGLYYANAQKDPTNKDGGFRVDLICVDIDQDKKGFRIRHYKNVT